MTTTTALDQALNDYLSVRRALGFKLAENGRQLPDFVDYLQAVGGSTVTTELAVAWATQPIGCTPVWWARRLAMVRGFARHLKAIDPATEVPPLGVLPHRCRRAAPYLYSDADVAALMAAAGALRSPLQAATYQTVIGLLAVTGMRSGEARRLDRDHLDWDEAVVTVWNSKFQNSRALPLHPTTMQALGSYAQLRDELCPHPKAPSFFITTTGTRLGRSFNKVFAGLVRSAGLAYSGRPPRPHDLRHRFAVRTLLGWYRAGANVDAHMPLLSTYLGHSNPENTFWYLSAVPELLFLASERLERGAPAMTALAPTLEAFFTERLMCQRQASPNTIAAYRDAWRLLLGFAAGRAGKQPHEFDVGDLDAVMIGAFLEHLEVDRHNSTRTRNARLAAIRSFFRYAALRHPEHGAVIARVLAIPTKRCDRAIVSFLTEPEADAVLARPDHTTWTGRRDHALLAVALQTGLRVSELTGLRNKDVELRTGAHVRCWGKGRKERCTPLRPNTVSVLRAWTKERGGASDEPLFPTRRGTHLSRDAVETLVEKHAATAANVQPSLRGKKVTPHVLRHSCAMALRRGGVDRAVLALWLGHEQVETTDIYAHADLSTKENALARTRPPHVRRGRYRPPDRLLAFLQGL